MPTVKSSPTTVEVEYNSVFVPAALAAFSAFLLGAAMLGSDSLGQAFGLTAGAGLCAFAAAVFRERSFLRIDWSEQTLSFAWTGFWKKSTAVELPLQCLLGIRTEFNPGGQSARTYRVCLVTSEQVIPLTQGFSSTWRNEGVALHGLLSDRGLNLTHDEKELDVSTLRGI